MLIFAKIYLNSFVWDVIDVFCSPQKGAVDIYSKHNIIKCFAELILTDTNSRSLFYICLEVRMFYN